VPAGLPLADFAGALIASAGAAEASAAASIRTATVHLQNIAVAR